jgi:hypothetical protein
VTTRHDWPSTGEHPGSSPFHYGIAKRLAQEDEARAIYLARCLESDRKIREWRKSKQSGAKGGEANRDRRDERGQRLIAFQLVVIKGGQP